MTVFTLFTALRKPKCFLSNAPSDCIISKGVHCICTGKTICVIIKHLNSLKNCVTGFLPISIQIFRVSVNVKKLFWSFQLASKFWQTNAIFSTFEYFGLQMTSPLRCSRLSLRYWNKKECLSGDLVISYSFFIWSRAALYAKSSAEFIQSKLSDVTEPVQARVPLHGHGLGGMIGLCESTSSARTLWLSTW